MNNGNGNRWWIFAVGAIALCCCLFVLCLSIILGLQLFGDFDIGLATADDLQATPLVATLAPATATPVEPSSTPQPGQTQTPVITESPTATDTPEATATSALLEPGDMLILLENTIVPINDPIELADRMEGKSNLAAALTTPPEILSTGARQDFWVNDSNTNENFEVSAVLRYITDHVYFWIEDGIAYNNNQLKSLVETFENKIYPTNREFFGSEWTPGVDNDPHLYILYTESLGGYVAGYFSTADQYLPEVRQYSNGHEMFVLSAEYVDLGEQFAYSVLAHEFQHMIHWYRDRNEDTWVNEGFSELAAFLNGYDVGGHDYLYVREPDIQLTDWPNNPDERSSHYGSSFLFMAYFLDRFGEEATRNLVADPANGMASINNILTTLQITDPLSGQTIHANDVFKDWVIASYLQDASVGDGRYTYHNYPSAPQPSATEDIRRCPQESSPRRVSQYGVDYIRIRCSGNYTLRFQGATQVKLIPEDPFSGSYAFYSNRGDESDMTLTRTFDFTGASGPLTLSYWTWYDLEKDYDYLYVLASVDGQNWQFLIPPSGTDEDPSGNSYGWGYNGLSGGGPSWIEETIDLSQFAGQQVQIRFEYITDAAVNGEGFLIDDISIPEIGYFTDFETDDGGWQAEGFVRILNSLPQVFQLSVISIGAETTVTTIQLTADNSAEIPLSLGSEVREVILVISGVTPFTRQSAQYQYSITP